MAVERISKEYPKIYTKFLGKKSNRSFWIQDLTEEYFEEVCDGYVNLFVRDEIICKHSNLIEDAQSLAEFRQIWLELLKQNISLICLTCDENNKVKIAGYNCLYLDEKKEKKEDMKLEGKGCIKVISILELLDSVKSLYDTLNIEKCLKAMGLFVLPDFRGDGIGEEILKARSYICKEINVPTSATAFTSFISQKQAKRAGFIEFSEIDYVEMGENHPEFKMPGIENHTKVLKLMYQIYE